MSTYEEVLEAWRAERSSEGLTKLPEGFYKSIAKLISDLRSSLKMADTSTLRARLARAELSNLEKIARDVFWTRVEKSIMALMAGRGLEVEKLTPEEKELLEPIELSFIELRKFLEGLLRGELRLPRGPTPVPAQAAEAPTQPQAQPKLPRRGLMLVRILADVPAIVGPDLRAHGPFKRGDIAFIPAENALGLIRKGLAVEVELREGAQGH